MSIRYQVFIRQMSLEVIIGLNTWEQSMPQQIVLDLELRSKQNFAMEETSTCIDYAKVSESVEQFAKQTQFKLLESFATRLSDLLIEQFKLNYVKISVAKPYILSTSQACGITLERELM